MITLILIHLPTVHIFWKLRGISLFVEFQEKMTKKNLFERTEEFGKVMARSFIKTNNRSEMERYKKLLKNKTGFLAEQAFFLELATYEDDFFGAMDLWRDNDITHLTQQFEK